MVILINQELLQCAKSWLKVLFISKSKSLKGFNSFLASSNFCCLPIAFVKSLDPEQDRQNVGPDLDQNRLTL